jgi:glycosyltransferase involved in cell wall biosynthesis
MTIGIDIRVLAKGTRTGVENYTIELLSRLLAIDKTNKYKIFYSGFRKPKLDYLWLKGSNIKVKQIRIPNRILDLFLRYLRFPKIDKILGGVDIFLSPHFLLTPVSKKTKTIIIFYDLSFIRFPEFFSRAKLLWHKFIYPKKQAQKADFIVAISESTKADLINLYKISPEKIKVIYPGINEQFGPANKNDPRLLQVANKYHLPSKFILYFGTIEPRKNISTLIKAFAEIKRGKSVKILDVDWLGLEGVVKNIQEKLPDFSDFKLVIAGTKGWLCQEVFETARDSEFKNDIIFTGFIDEEDRPYLYNLASIFVYPSFFEGFGLPPLEAMACGVPTIVSNKSSLPEVVGAGAIMVDPQNIDELVFTIKAVLGNNDLRQLLIRRSIERAKLFDWDEAVKQFLEIFQQYAHRN